MKKHISNFYNSTQVNLITCLAFIIFATFLLFATNADAGNPPQQSAFKLYSVDVYGTDDKDASRILTKYKDKISKLTAAWQPDPQKPNGINDMPAGGDIALALKDELLAEGRYSFVDLGYIIYYTDKNYALTIDLVDKKDQQTRNTFDPAPNGHPKDPHGLVKAWMEYEAKGWELLNTGKLKADEQECSANHCVFGFEHQQLAPYQAQFDAVDKYEKQIVKVLHNDKDPKKRAAAAFLLGHLSNPENIRQDLLTSLHDPDPGVRNNVMRVLAFTKLKHKDMQLNANDFVAAINGPTTIDRNKALFVVSQLVDDPESAKLFNVKQTKQILVNILKLKQPNNHDFAYRIVKKISHKNYPETDIKSWTAWANS